MKKQGEGKRVRVLAKIGKGGKRDRLIQWEEKGKRSGKRYWSLKMEKAALEGKEFRFFYSEEKMKKSVFVLCIKEEETGKARNVIMLIRLPYLRSLTYPLRSPQQRHHIVCFFLLF